MLFIKIGCFIMLTLDDNNEIVKDKLIPRNADTNHEERWITYDVSFVLQHQLNDDGPLKHFSVWSKTMIQLIGRRIWDLAKQHIYSYVI